MPLTGTIADQKVRVEVDHKREIKARETYILHLSCSGCQDCLELTAKWLVPADACWYLFIVSRSHALWTQLYEGFLGDSLIKVTTLATFDHDFNTKIKDYSLVI